MYFPYSLESSLFYKDPWFLLVGDRIFRKQDLGIGCDYHCSGVSACRSLSIGLGIHRVRDTHTFYVYVFMLISIFTSAYIKIREFNQISIIPGHSAQFSPFLDFWISFFLSWTVRG